MAIQSNLINKTGNIASAAASAVVYTTVLDLSANYGAGVAWVSKRNGVTSAGESLTLEYSNDNVNWFTMVNYQLTGQAFNSTSGINMDTGGRIQGRYLRGRYVNGSTAQPATAVLTLYVQPDTN